MKLWSTIDLERLPHILKNGFDNPYSDEVLFWNDVQVGADNALAFDGELAFIEAEIPDDQFEGYFAPCLGLLSDSKSDLESEIKYAKEGRLSASDIAQMRKDIETMEKIDTARDSMDFFGYACLMEVIPPSMLKLLNLEQTMEAVHSGDAEAIAHALETAEATDFKSLGSAFWVWLIMLVNEIFGPGHGAQEGDVVQESQEEEEQRLERMRERAAKRPRKKRERKKVQKV